MENGTVTTIQQTSKRWKGIYLIGVIGAIVSFLATIIATHWFPFCLFIAFTSVAVYAKVMAWWHHG
jgi:hypothetical protein